MAKRIGARSRDSIDPAVLERLHQGLEASATLSEALAVNFGTLIGHVVPDISSKDRQRIMDAQALGITKRMDLVASILAAHLGKGAAEALKSHKSDTVRGWAAFIIGKDAGLSLGEKLSSIRPLADDTHFGVREWAWLALRNSIASDIRIAIQLLNPWVKDQSENIRRFAIEGTRPRGVWSKHIAVLTQSPSLGQVLLDEVMEDPSRYVQDSCGNWLNDAAKSSPKWVVDYCRAWQSRSSSASVDYIVRRGLRNVE